MKGLVIGRFQPFHNGHHGMIKWAMERCDELIIGIGSPNKCDERNPFRFWQRVEMIERTLPTDAKYETIQIPDVGNNEKWIKWIKENVEFDVFFSNSRNELTIFENANLKTIYNDYRLHSLCATDIRNKIDEIKANVPKGTWDVMTGK